MAADSQGNDIGAVGIPITGFLAFAPEGTGVPSSADGGDDAFVLPGTFKKAGLLKTDGGPQFTWGATGDALEFWQIGYSLKSGDADVTFQATFAQTDDFIRQIVYGKVPDVNGMILVDGGGHDIVKTFWSEEIFKNGAVRRRSGDKCTVQTVVEDRSTRGEVLGYAVTFKVDRSSSLSNNHFAEWVLPPISGS